MKIYLNEQYKCVKVADNTFVANSTSNFVRYYFVRNADGTVVDEITAQTEVYLNQEPSYVTLGFRRADGNTIQHLMATPKVENAEPFWEYIITDADGVLYKKGALEVSAQFINATLNSENKIISQKVMAVAINTAHILDNIGEEAEEYYSQYEQANNEAHAALQAQFTTNFNNIGILQELTTDAKDNLVKAINEVDAHADANKSEIGDLSALTTDEKTTIVGAINEVDAHADTAQQTAETAQTTADNATTLANNAVGKAEQAVVTANEAKTTAQTAETNANSAVDTANAANATADEAKAIAQGNQRAIGFATLQAAITALNGYNNTQLKVGDNVYIVETGVPDLWVAAVEQNSVAYNYTTNDAFNDDLVENTLVQVGYYKFAYLESDGKPCTVAWQNMTVAASDWVASTEFADFPYEAKIALSDFVNFSSIPQVVFGLTEATSGNYAPICKAGDKGVYIYSKVNTAITLPTVVTFAPNVHGASMQGGGYTNKGKWVASTTYAIDDLVYTDNGQFVCIEGITSTTSPEQDTTHWQATFVATGKTKNALKIGGQDNGTQVQKTFDGSQAVEVAFDETTMTAKEVNGVLKVGAKGTVPEALPATGAKITGELPTSGWTVGSIIGTLWSGNITASYSYEATPISTDSNLISYLRSLSGSGNYIYVASSWNNTTEPRKFTWQDGDTGQVWFSSDYGVIKVTSSAVKYSPKINQTDTIYAIGKESTDFSISQRYTISDTAIKSNSTVSMYLNSADEVRAYSKTDGSVVVEMDAVPTVAIPYTLQVVETSTEGAFEIINSYVPSIPETPTALPQEASALKSGSLPTTGWSDGSYVTYWTGDNIASGTVLKFLFNNPNIYNDIANNTKIVGRYTMPSSDVYEKKLTNQGIKTINNITGYVLTPYEGSYVSREIQIIVSADGNVYGTGYASASSQSYSIHWTMVGKYEIKQKIYSIADTDITENSDVLMELTDEGGVKANALANGSISVIRDSVPTQPIPYTYKVKQTNASGQFTVINHYTPEIPEVPTNAQIIDLIYPVGSIYMSINSANPSTFLGGTWEAWGAGKVPVGVDANDTDFATVEKTGGEKTHTLTESEIPAHRHTVEAIGTGTTQQELNAFSVNNQGAVDSYGTTNTAGGGQAHNNLQPYITCYMWKRTA